MLEMFPQPAREFQRRMSHIDSGHSQDWFDLFHAYVKLTPIQASARRYIPNSILRSIVNCMGSNSYLLNSKS